jgi:hypothetical protein
LRYNLDVMHIEKNVMDNIPSTILDIKGKIKDNLEARNVTTQGKVLATSALSPQKD